MAVLAVKEKLASGSKTSFDADGIIAVAHLVADLPQERSAANDELASDQNVYAYVGNNPVNYTDPTGEFIWVPGLVVGTGAAAATLATGGSWTEAGFSFVSGFAVGSGVAAIPAIGRTVVMGLARLGLSQPAAQAGAQLVLGSAGSTATDAGTQFGMMKFGGQTEYDWGRTGIAALGGLAGSTPQAGLAYFGARTASSMGGSAAVGAQIMQPSTFSQQATMGIFDTAASARVESFFAPPPPPPAPSQNLQQFASPIPSTPSNTGYYDFGLSSTFSTTNYTSGGSAGTVGRIK